MRDVVRGVDDVVREELQEQRKQDEEEEFGEKKATRQHDLRHPSVQESTEHEMTHHPFRSWCVQCMKGRGREEDCRKQMEEEGQAPEIHLDHMVMGDSRESHSVGAGNHHNDTQSD